MRLRAFFLASFVGSFVETKSLKPGHKGTQMKKPILLALAVFVTCWSQATHARDAFVMLSGGDSPMANNFSQYLQARAVSAFFLRSYPTNSVWVFFGAGNKEGEKPFFGDVLRESQRDGLTISSWLPGSLSQNRPATREVILRALRDEILPTVANGGTLYLFVGDHGARAGGRNGESVISLWSLERDSKSDRGWRTHNNETLGVTELRRVLAQGLGKGRVVFCMTQCHAGGFHYLAVPREVMPNPKWFTKVPAWVVAGEKIGSVRAAGFAATDESSAAAGCEPDPDPDEWAGYERFVPEQWLGMNLFTLQPAARGLRSFAEAHVAATLVDGTIDKPYSTSEQYLERWANLIETRLSSAPDPTSALKDRLAAYRRTVDGAAPKVSDRLFRDRQAQFGRFTARLTEQNTAARDLLLKGTRKELEAAIGTSRGRGPGRQPRPPADQTQGASAPPANTLGAANEGTVKAKGGSQETAQSPAPGPRRRRGANTDEARGLWKESIRPVWQNAVDSNQVNGVTGAAREFEKHLLREEAQGREYLFADEGLLDEEIFWRSGYSNPQTLNQAKAEAIARWGAERRDKILAWAANGTDEQVRTAAAKLSQLMARRWGTPAAQAGPARPSGSPLPQISKKVAAQRTLFYRRVLGAWEFLLTMRERPALARVRELTELERAPLPRPGARL